MNNYLEKELAIKFNGHIRDVKSKLIDDLGFEIVKNKAYQRTYMYKPLVETKQSYIIRVRYDDKNDIHITIKTGVIDLDHGIKERYKVNIPLASLEDGMIFASLAGYKYDHVRERLTTKFVKDDIKLVINQNPYGKIMDIEAQNPDDIWSLVEELGYTKNDVVTTSAIERWKEFCTNEAVEYNPNILFTTAKTTPKGYEEKVVRLISELKPLSIDDFVK